MASVYNIRVGSKPVEKILFSSYRDDPQSYAFDLRDWEVNTEAGHDIDVSFKSLTIRKFKPNEWILRSAYDSMTNTKFCELFYGIKWRLENVAARVTDGTITSYGHGTWGGPTYYARGVVLAPFAPGYWPYTISYPWELNIAGGKLKNPNYGWATYGFSADGEQTLWNVSAFNTLSGVGTAYQGALILYTGNTDILGDDGLIDISDDPIVITLVSSMGIDPSSVECWDVRQGSKPVYRKLKTVENCWIPYNLASFGVLDNNVTRYLQVQDTSGNSITLLPEVTDWKQWMNWIEEYTDTTSEGEEIIGYARCYTRFKIKIGNTAFWEKLRAWLAENRIWNLTKLLHDCNIGGELTIKVAGRNDVEWSPLENYNGRIGLDYMTAGQMLAGTSIDKLFVDCNAVITVMNAMLYGSDDFEIEWSGNPCKAKDFAGCWNYSALKTLPANMINWGERDGIWASNICYMFEYGQMTEVPVCNIGGNTDREASVNTLMGGQYCPQVFNGIPLVSFGPVLDLRYTVDGYETPGSDRYRMFANMEALTDIRLKNLNHATWRFDGSGYDNVTVDDVNMQTFCGHIPNLDAESVAYLFENLYDLTSRGDYTIEYSGNTTFCEWNNLPSDFVTTDIGRSFTTKTRYAEGTGYLAVPRMQYTGALDMQLKVSGMLEGDRIVQSNHEMSSVYLEITADGTYNVTNVDGTDNGFRFYSSDASRTSAITLEIVGGFKPDNPKNDHADLMCPAGWAGIPWFGTDWTIDATGASRITENGRYNEAQITKRLATTGNVSSYLYTSSKVYENLRLKVEGLVEGDNLIIGKYGTLAGQAEGTTVITEDGEYTLASFGTTSLAFRLANDDTSLTDAVKITLLSADGHENKITDDMVSAANAKGWTVYVNGELREVATE